MPGEEVSQAKQQLKVIVDAYLQDSDVQQVLAACDFADLAHSGITRKSGEPYVLHPIAVSCILAHMRLDADTLMAALLHDVIVVVGMFSILDKEFSLTVVAALLTVVGYSLNDTIVVFDRIRENQGKYRKKPFEETINLSITETLSRTLITSGTTLFVVLSLFLLGGEIIHDFAFALLVGVLIGTYSSIYVASPLVVFLTKLAPPGGTVLKSS